MRLKADLTLLFVSIIWGSAFVAQRVVGRLGSVYLFNGARYLLAALVVLPFVRRRDISSMPKDQFKWMFVAGLILFLGSALQQAGMVYTTASNAGFITGLYVVLVPVFLFIFWRIRPHWLSVLAVFLAAGGAYLLSTAGEFRLQRGDTVEFIGAIFWTLHVIVLGRFARDFEPMSFSLGQLIVCGILNSLMGFLFESPIQVSWEIFYAVSYTAFFALGLCYTLQIWAQRHTSPSDAALILSLESVFAAISGWVMLHESLRTIQLAGCVLIFLAVVISQLRVYSSTTVDHDHLVEGR